MQKLWSCSTPAFYASGNFFEIKSFCFAISAHKDAKQNHLLEGPSAQNFPEAKTGGQLCFVYRNILHEPLHVTQVMIYPPLSTYF